MKITQVKMDGIPPLLCWDIYYNWLYTKLNPEYNTTKPNKRRKKQGL